MLSPSPSPSPSPSSSTKVCRKRSIKEGLLIVSEAVARTVSPIGLDLRRASNVGVGTKILYVPEAPAPLRKTRSSSHLCDARDNLTHSSGPRRKTMPGLLDTAANWEAFAFSNVPVCGFHSPRKAPSVPRGRSKSSPERPTVKVTIPTSATAPAPAHAPSNRPTTMPANICKPLPLIPGEPPALPVPSPSSRPPLRGSPISPLLTVIPESPAEYPAYTTNICELEGCSPVSPLSPTKFSSPTIPTSNKWSYSTPPPPNRSPPAPPVAAAKPTLSPLGIFTELPSTPPESPILAPRRLADDEWPDSPTIPAWMTNGKSAPSPFSVVEEKKKKSPGCSRTWSFITFEEPLGVQAFDMRRPLTPPFALEAEVY